MPKSLDELQHLLAANGYECERLLDAIVATKVATRTYASPAGEKQLEILLTFDRPNDCVAVEILRAFDLRKAAHREAALACLMTASARTPLVRPALEPEGDVRLRIDCTCGAEGARDEDVLRAVALLPNFADAWHEQITAAMETGSFDPSKVVHLTISRLTPCSRPEPADTPSLAADAMSPSADATSPSGNTLLDDVLRAARILRKPGAHPNRLRKLFEFHKSLGGRDQDTGERN